MAFLWFETKAERRNREIYAEDIIKYAGALPEDVIDRLKRG